MFSYCSNNPVVFCDSTGTSSFSIFRKLGRIIKGLYNTLSFSNFLSNTSADSKNSTTTKNKIINDQNGTTGNTFKYGLHDASWNACEAIAVHNAKVLTNRESSLSKTLRDFQRNGAMIGDGYFGSNPLLIGRVLNSQGIYNNKVKLDEMTSAGVYIISFWNDGAPCNGLHTVAVSYDGATYTTYNLKGRGETSNLNPADYANNYICGYYLGAAL